MLWAQSTYSSQQTSSSYVLARQAKLEHLYGRLAGSRPSTAAEALGLGLDGVEAGGDNEAEQRQAIATRERALNAVPSGSGGPIMLRVADEARRFGRAVFVGAYPWLNAAWEGRASQPAPIGRHCMTECV